jgi:hypothetical protein
MDTVTLIDFQTNGGALRPDVQSAVTVVDLTLPVANTRGKEQIRRQVGTAGTGCFLALGGSAGVTRKLL